MNRFSKSIFWSGFVKQSIPRYVSIFRASFHEPPLKIGFQGAVVLTEPPLEKPDSQEWCCQENRVWTLLTGAVDLVDL